MASFSFFFKKERYSEQQEIAPEKAWIYKANRYW
jgi:hypothetical protein